MILVKTGRDVKGGTWFGITKEGRFTSLTNFVTPPQERVAQSKSKGEIFVFVNTLSIAHQ